MGDSGGRINGTCSGLGWGQGNGRVGVNTQVLILGDRMVGGAIDRDGEVSMGGKEMHAIWDEQRVKC